MALPTLPRFVLNEREVELGSPDGPAGGLSVLDFVRRHRRLTGTKEGCKEGDCGACTVLIGELHDDGDSVRYAPVTSCMMPVAELGGKHLVTIEGLDLGRCNTAQRRIVEHGASQCGFCTPGIAVSLTGRLMDGPPP
ncbi:MAG: 2Fe-2S iron-sulfur cluster-binding protein, partial [Acidobacteriota bacterium]